MRSSGSSGKCKAPSLLESNIGANMIRPGVMYYSQCDAPLSYAMLSYAMLSYAQICQLIGLARPLVLHTAPFPWSSAPVARYVLPSLVLDPLLSYAVLSYSQIVN